MQVEVEVEVELEVEGRSRGGESEVQKESCKLISTLPVSSQSWKKHMLFKGVKGSLIRRAFLEERLFYLSSSGGHFWRRGSFIYLPCWHFWLDIKTDC